MSTVEGIVLRSYSLLTRLSASSRTGKVTPSLVATSAALLGSSSTLTPRRTKPLERYFWYRRLSCGISCRHGAHQVAQKLTITTRPRWSCRRMFGPLIACSEKSGAGVDGAIADDAVPATTAKTTLATMRNAEAERTIDKVFMAAWSEVEGEPAGELRVVRALPLAEQVEREDVVADVELERGPVGEIDAVAEPEVEGGLALVGELGAADAGDHIELRRPRAAAADEDLDREQVVADRGVVVVELLARRREDAARQDLAEQLVAHLRLAVCRLDEEVLGDVVADARAVDPARAEVLRCVGAGEQAHLEVVRRELRLRDVAPVDLGNDDLVVVGRRRALRERAASRSGESHRRKSLAQGLVVHRWVRFARGAWPTSSEEEGQPRGPRAV